MILRILQVKNTVYCLARENEFSSPEQFGVIITRHFLSTYPSLVNKVNVQINTVRWERVHNADSHGVTRPHKHGFRKVGPTSNYAWYAKRSTICGARKNP